VDNNKTATTRRKISAAVRLADDIKSVGEVDIIYEVLGELIKEQTEDTNNGDVLRHM
jgi:hypothetical protein